MLGNGFNQRPSGYPSQSGIAGVPFVDSIESAKACNIPFGSNAMVAMNKDQDIFYLKWVDEKGQPFITAYEFREIPPPKKPEYITRDDFDKAMNGMRSKYESIIQSIQTQQSEHADSSKQSDSWVSESTTSTTESTSTWPSDELYKDNGSTTG